ncbi:hypothetical protein GGTG_09285 [Gaeumannomyces tritici R3-111a-1]|uniref:Uncharacterized protein n=1 Tax=Gaeumannomyces tritici (strain R3-111a-1) TaxID=644352 RepID=J3P6Y8_GAET3|nr:hypothetical protein GGTG_09285 [Gaeumannomyces tritici R3-111a-1]EJT72419.1 hypothetical protein GGTG_09285 [Gaeumannomyces tritici R3-111a-1]
MASSSQRTGRPFPESEEDAAATAYKLGDRVYAWWTGVDNLSYFVSGYVEFSDNPEDMDDMVCIQATHSADPPENGNLPVWALSGHKPLLRVWRKFTSKSPPYGQAIPPPPPKLKSKHKPST